MFQNTGGDVPEDCSREMKRSEGGFEDLVFAGGFTRDIVNGVNLDL
jgi:hypothetical protein